MKTRQFFKVLSLGIMLAMTALFGTACSVRTQAKRKLEKFGFLKTTTECVSLTNKNNLKSSSQETTTTTVKYLSYLDNTKEAVYPDYNLRTAVTATNDKSQQMTKTQEKSQVTQQETTTIEVDNTIETNINQESNISSIVLNFTTTLNQDQTEKITDAVREITPKSTTKTTTKATTKIITEVATQDATGVKTQVTSKITTQDATETTTQVTSKITTQDATGAKTQDTSTIVTQATTEIITNEIIQKDDKEDSEYVYNIYGKPVDKNNCLYLNGNYIEIMYGPATSSNVDEYDVVQDTELWSDERNKYLFGHSVGSFKRLSKNKVGDEIILVNNGVARRYVTIRSEYGHLTKNNTEIESNVDGCNLIHSDFGCETIRLITCHGWSQDGRWVVIARRIE